MNTKTDVEVIINGKQYTLSGYESSEYLQRIANHINEKFAELRQSDGYLKLDTDVKYILLAINLSDEMYKAQQMADELQKGNEDLEKEIFNMKHDMIAMRSQIEEKEKEIEDLKKEIEKLKEQKTEKEHQVIRLETELEGAKEKTEKQSDRPEQNNFPNREKGNNGNRYSGNKKR